MAWCRRRSSPPASRNRRSAWRSICNSIHTLTNLYDGFLLLSTIGQRIRQDLSTPVFKVLTEFDVTGFNEANVRQNDTAKFRTWEVAGTSHVDQHLRDSREPLELRDNGVSTEATNLDPPPPAGMRHQARRDSRSNDVRPGVRVRQAGEMGTDRHAAANGAPHPDCHVRQSVDSRAERAWAWRKGASSCRR